MPIYKDKKEIKGFFSVCYAYISTSKHCNLGVGRALVVLNLAGYLRDVDTQQTTKSIIPRVPRNGERKRVHCPGIHHTSSRNVMVCSRNTIQITVYP